MRADMSKVIVERPRFKGRGWKRRSRLIGEDLPAREGMRRPHVLRHTEKDFNDLLGPIRRYLDKQVGRPWNAIYREICAPLRAGRLADDHLKRHIREHVAFDVTMDADGTPRCRAASWGRHGWVHQPCFVHPRSGILRRTPGRHG